MHETVPPVLLLPTFRWAVLYSYLYCFWGISESTVDCSTIRVSTGHGKVGECRLAESERNAVELWEKWEKPLCRVQFDEVMFWFMQRVGWFVIMCQLVCKFTVKHCALLLA